MPNFLRGVTKKNGPPKVAPAGHHWVKRATNPPKWNLVKNAQSRRGGRRHTRRQRGTRR